jgi:hypothetical protein
MTLEPDRSTLQVTRNVNPVTLVIDSGNFLIGKIKVLESTGDARLLSRPSILTLDNMGATIDLSTTFYVRVVGERVAEVVPVTASTTLRVTPRYVEKNGKRLIQLVIDIEDGSLQDSEQIGQLPTVVRSSVNTEAVVGENQSLLIGGYKIDSDISQNDGLAPDQQDPDRGGVLQARAQGDAAARAPVPHHAEDHRPGYGGRSPPRSSACRPSARILRRPGRTEAQSTAAAASPMRSLRVARARETRLRTVPTGIASMVAASS